MTCSAKPLVRLTAEPDVVRADSQHKVRLLRATAAPTTPAEMGSGPRGKVWD